ncbi:hypothetical protein GCM10011375_25620 [Hymenobacter qilianensis]|uniref:Streptomycin biosynthesis protein StrF domain-containing protein n=2 Tax=Hymenobacter qilianensis TaxID=1385715 RepID=A0A7H0GWH2_9BACT|nr:glycosyltransferase [Hymenobacter qilianensis]QNP52638.1 hypothetical protein H9L05_02425 [Hymenobacter qilianensis]GGF69431.1 hypothetical protein GCM10011375_25620 [Hymenobacter qilianensis]
MISIIICSRSAEMLSSAAQSIEATIGLPYQIIDIDNSKGTYSIFQAYNLGISKSQFNVLCFMHEDVGFITNGWGEKVVNAFQNNPKLGLLGVAGSSYKSLLPSGWSFSTATDKTLYMNVVQHYKADGSSIHDYSNPRNESLSKVAAVDGVWFCTTREVVNQIKFDDTVFNGFHCYDVDFSLSVLQKYDVAVTYEVLLNHFSEGSFNDGWLSDTIKLHNKWKNVLPVNLNNLSADAIALEETKAFYAILPKLAGKRQLCLDALKVIWKSNVIARVGIKMFTRMNLLLLKKSLE